MIIHGDSVALWEVGDCRATMRQWALDGVRAQTCVTSPPYFGLRDYGHEAQIGLEQTPTEYVDALVGVFRCVRDLLTKDGTLWLNIGDSYAGSGRGGYPACKTGLQGTVAGQDNSRAAQTRVRSSRRAVSSAQRPAAPTSPGGRMCGVEGLKRKDLIGIPWMLAFALRTDGWFLRQDIIWHKPNPTPESVRDRCTKSHEYLFLLSKSERYLFDARAMAEPAIYAPGKTTHVERPHGFYGGKGTDASHGAGNRNFKAIRETRNRRSVWSIATRGYAGAHFATFPPALVEPCVLAGSRPGDTVLDPFGGSGTTAGVAVKHGRNALLCELSDTYAALMPDRIRSIAQ